MSGGVRLTVRDDGPGLPAPVMAAFTKEFPEQADADSGLGLRWCVEIRRAVGKILSRREQEVLSHVLAGKTSREISELIGLSARTVEFHRANIMAKLGATNVTELVASARQRGLG